MGRGSQPFIPRARRFGGKSEGVEWERQSDPLMMIIGAKPMRCDSPSTPSLRTRGMFGSMGFANFVQQHDQLDFLLTAM